MVSVSSSQHYPALFDLSTFADLNHVHLDPSPLRDVQDSVSELEGKVKEFYMTGPGENMAATDQTFISAPVFKR